MRFKTQGEYNVWLNKCYDLVIEDMKTSGLIKEWDGEPTYIRPEDHFSNIVKWCKDNIKSRVWSIHKSSKNGFRTSYGAKHICERKLKCYVANNWMKLAMIFSGLEVCNGNCRDFETDRINPLPVSFQDIITGNESFICRRKISSDDKYYIQYDCIYPFEPEELKYIR